MMSQTKCVFLFFLCIALLIFLKYTPTDYNKKRREEIKTLIRQSARWSTAAAQDENAMIAVLHANYGAGYLWALKDIARDEEIEEAAQINIDTFTREVIQIQDEANIKMAKLCPSFAPEKSYLTSLAGEGV